MLFSKGKNEALEAARGQFWKDLKVFVAKVAAKAPNEEFAAQGLAWLMATKHALITDKRRENIFLTHAQEAITILGEYFESGTPATLKGFADKIASWESSTKPDDFTKYSHVHAVFGMSNATALDRFVMSRNPATEWEGVQERYRNGISTAFLISALGWTGGLVAATLVTGVTASVAIAPAVCAIALAALLAVLFFRSMDRASKIGKRFDKASVELDKAGVDENWVKSDGAFNNYTYPTGSWGLMKALVADPTNGPPRPAQSQEGGLHNTDATAA